MSDVVMPYRRPLNIGSQALNPRQRRDFSNFFASQSLNRLRMRTRMRQGRGRTRVLYRRRYSTTRQGILGGTNADNRLVYRKKSMPRKKKKRWASFIRRVNAVDERELGTRTVLVNDSIQQNNVTAGTQSCLTLALYPFVNGTNGWLDDMNVIGQLENSGNPTAAAGGTVDRNTKIMFHSAVMDVTIRNTSQKYTAPDVADLSADAALELDVYDLVVRQNSNDISNTLLSLSALLNAYDQREIGGGGTGIAIGDRGCTPFELPSGISRFGIKVLKKTKFFIPNGQTVTFQVRNPKRKVISYGDLTQNDGFNRKGWTTFKFLVYKLVPGLVYGTSVGQYKARIDVGCTRKYMYKVEGFNEPRERLVGNSYTVNINES